MSEESERVGSGPEGNGAGIDPTAVALALAGASRERADSFLIEQEALIAGQRRLVDLQAKELAHELKLRHWSLQLRHASAILKFTLEVSLALIGVAIACFTGAVVWNAAHADGLIVDEFSVPPNLATRGLTGQAIAGQLMDKLSEMQSETSSNRAPQSFANDWDNNIKVEIPDTGVSVGEVYNFLKSRLGHETHVSGDVWQTQNGLAITARTSDGGSNAVNGTEPDLDSLIQKTAEGIYGRTQPYRYANYLAGKGRLQEALALDKSVAATGDLNDRGWAYLGWTNFLIDAGTAAERERLLKQALQYGNALVTRSFAGLENNLGRPELALSYNQKADALLRSGGSELDPRRISGVSQISAADDAALRGDYHAAVQGLEAAIEAGSGAGPSEPTYPTLAGWQIHEHDLAGARKTLENAPPSQSQRSYAPGLAPLAALNDEMQIAEETGDWETVLAKAQAMAPSFRKYPGGASLKPTAYDPLIAIADARLGKFADAERLISPTPADCYPCLMARGRIAAIQRQNARADWWYARAVSSNPSIPLAESDWGEVFLARGQPDAAIEKFKLSNHKGPHFADPLEGWGEALIAKNQSHLALAKFTEAEKHAPNWGRLHLKWGEALYYAGKKDEAKEQFVRAAALDLTPSEKAELAGMNRG
jgi:tetratricopeptide (TPR) repeat protein